MPLPRTGYNADSLLANITLGLVDGLDGALWSYAFATIIFTGALSVFLPVGIFVILCGWALVAIVVTVTS